MVWAVISLRNINWIHTDINKGFHYDRVLEKKNAQHEIPYGRHLFLKQAFELRMRWWWIIQADIYNEHKYRQILKELRYRLLHTFDFLLNGAISQVE